MTVTRRSLMWPILIIAIGCVLLLQAAGAFPEAVGDLLLRSWPALVILFGLDVLFGRRRLRILGRSIEISLVALVVLVIALAGVIWLAYANQANELRTDNVVAFEETVAADVEQVLVIVEVDRVGITVGAEAGGGRELTAEFAGSRESEVTMDWAVEAGTGTLTIRETHPSSIPKLEDYGRGSLDIGLPPDVTVQQLVIAGARGDVTIDLLPVRVQQIDVSVVEGDVTVALPGQDTLQGKVTARDGAIQLTVPEQIALIVGLQPGSGTPSYEYDRLRYDVLLDGQLKRSNTDAFQISLDVWLKNGAALTVIDQG